MKFILGQKIGMSQVFEADGKRVPVTVVQAGPVVITQVRSEAKDGYQAVQVGFGEKKRLNKPLLGSLKGLGMFRWLREFRVSELKVDDKELTVGATIGVDLFKPGEKVTVSGVSKAKGFQGVVKRHGFSGGPRTHGQKHSEREPGSIGIGGMQRVMKGMRMAGRMGGERVSVSGLKIVRVDSEHNLLVLEGAVPGRKGMLLEIVQR